MENRFGLSADQLERAADLHRRAIVIDGLISSKLDRDGAASLAAGGVTASNYTAAFPHHDLGQSLADLVAVRRAVAALDETLALATSVREIEQAKRDGRSALILGLQHAPGLGEHPSIAEAFHALGVRIIQLTYNEPSPLGSSCLMPDDGGLTARGREVVAALNDARVLIDLSHVGDQTSREVIKASAAPVAFTHANPRAFCDSPRNKPDDLLRALADRGGVIGVCCWGPICWTSTQTAPTIETFLDAIDYTVRLIGPDHVGISTDQTEGIFTDRETWYRTWGPGGHYPAMVRHLAWYTFERRWVEGLDRPFHLPRLTQGLVARGYTDADILKILGGNFLRLFHEVWGD